MNDIDFPVSFMRMTKKSLFLILWAGLTAFALPAFAQDDDPVVLDSAVLRLATFEVDVTPPVGTRLAYDTAINTWDMGLRARGIVLLGAGSPVVLCAVDWIGIANGGQDAFKKAFAEAAGTIPGRVAVHTVHQHDAPICDFTSEQILREWGIDPQSFDGAFSRQSIIRIAGEIKRSLKHAQPVSFVGLGQAEVFRVASNRRILGDDGRVRATRYTACRDSALRAEPEGLIDPMVSLVSFWNGEKPIAVLSYYAVHPQSYYRTGIPNPDFPGVARFFRQLAVPEALHVHFNGAGGDLGAGKYNDGSKENRLRLAERLADGMKRAWEATCKEPVTASSVEWSVVPVTLAASDKIREPGTWIKEEAPGYQTNTIFKMAWKQRLEEGRQIDVACLGIGNVRILHLPGELFVAYQLAAKAERPDLFVTVAAYGDYGPGYIGTAEAYRQGGYETGEASGVTPQAETVLMAAIRKLLRQDE